MARFFGCVQESFQAGKITRIHNPHDKLSLKLHPDSFGPLGNVYIVKLASQKIINFDIKSSIPKNN